MTSSAMVSYVAARLEGIAEPGGSRLPPTIRFAARSQLRSRRAAPQEHRTSDTCLAAIFRAFSAAARDPLCADTFAAFGSRCIGVSRFLRPVGARDVGERSPCARCHAQATKPAPLNWSWFKGGLAGPSLTDLDAVR